MILVEERQVVWSWDIVRACEQGDAKASRVGRDGPETSVGFDNVLVEQIVDALSCSLNGS